ncbi:MAG: methyltransferase type 11 [Gimesia sp.]|nr:methyltransferase type 11 [Gimesia sp.]
MSEEKCCVCSTSMQPIFKGCVLQRHQVTYFQCADCGFLRTQNPTWLDEAYSSAIARSDTGLVVRNLQIARRLACVLDAFFEPDGRFLDTAGGTGLLTRLMRDTGFDFWWEDPYCNNVMAAGFEVAPAASDFEAVTAFEALEHMVNPMEFIKDSLSRSRTKTLIFSTELYAPPKPRKDWWYLAQSTGQHISFFTRKTMETIAVHHGLNFYSQGLIHMLTEKSIDPKRYRKTMRRVDRGLYEKVAIRMHGLTQADHEKMIQQAVSAPAIQSSGA